MLLWLGKSDIGHVLNFLKQICYSVLVGSLSYKVNIPTVDISITILQHVWRPEMHKLKHYKQNNKDNTSLSNL